MALETIAHLIAHVLLLVRSSLGEMKQRGGVLYTLPFIQHSKTKSTQVRAQLPEAEQECRVVPSNITAMQRTGVPRRTPSLTPPRVVPSAPTCLLTASARVRQADSPTKDKLKAMVRGEEIVIRPWQVNYILYLLLTDVLTLKYVFFMITSSLTLFYSYYCSCVHLLNIMQRVPTMRYVAQARAREGARLPAVASRARERYLIPACASATRHPAPL